MTTTSPAEVMRPPGAAQALLAGFVADDGVREAMLGDLAEEFDGLQARVGRRRALAWYWRQTLGALPPLMRTELSAAPAELLGWAVAAYVMTAIGMLTNNALLSFVLLPTVARPGSGAFCTLFVVLSLAGVGLLSATLTRARLRRACCAPFAEVCADCVVWLAIGASWIGAGLGSSPLWYRSSIHAAAALAAVVAAGVATARSRQPMRRIP